MAFAHPLPATGGCDGRRAMSTLGRINLLVVLFFAAVTLVCTGVLLRQASQDVQREMIAARAVVEYLHEAARRDPRALESALARGLRHVRIHWQGETPRNRAAWTPGSVRGCSRPPSNTASRCNWTMAGAC